MLPQVINPSQGHNMAAGHATCQERYSFSVFVFILVRMLSFLSYLTIYAQLRRVYSVELEDNCENMIWGVSYMDGRVAISLRNHLIICPQEAKEITVTSSKYRRNMDSDLKAEHPEYGAELYCNIRCFVNRFS
jgi:hypothetical protein